MRVTTFAPIIKQSRPPFIYIIMFAGWDVSSNGCIDGGFPVEFMTGKYLKRTRTNVLF